MRPRRETVCPCGGAASETGLLEAAERPLDLEWRALIDCPDEWTALTVVTELESHDVPTWVRPLAVPGYQGLVGFAFPHWGTILVPRRDWLEAAVVLKDLGLTGPLGDREDAAGPEGRDG